MIDETLEKIKTLLAQEENKQINNLDQLHTSQANRYQIAQFMNEIDLSLQPIRRAIKDLPELPPSEPIQWAQNLLRMPGCRILEIDTTGLGVLDGICRITLADVNGSLFDDICIKPAEGKIYASATAVNGITNDDIANAPALPEVWDRIAVGLQGCYVVSFAQDWDRQQLIKAAELYKLPPIYFLGEDLQKRSTQYYQEYGLKLADVAERMTGQRLPKPATAIDRVKAAGAIITGMAEAVYDKRPMQPVNQTDTNNDDLGELREHPF